MFEKCINFNFFFVRFLSIVLLLFTMPTNQQQPTTPTVGTTEGEVTDLSENEVDKALLMDFGLYTPVEYHYEVNQWINHQKEYPWIGKHTDARLEMCYHQYLRCATSQESPAPVCAFYSQVWESGVKTVDTYCDAFFENCRIGYQYWRLITYGKCDLGRTYGWDEVIEY
ncbi:uncharacterized protein LOC113495015 [Trichoplusia ni]|uniref:Uncharacterized protein LOC113495015 n=1 Tax=Trichoplusia ni TaxID=7111 RepID=A0A7E5VM56_TRINI|nr:uncharacterized protein LOC113495015 [Trichoplusia ni]